MLPFKIKGTLPISNGMKKFLTIIITVILLGGSITFYTYVKCVEDSCPFENILNEFTAKNETLVDKIGDALQEVSPGGTNTTQNNATPLLKEIITPGPLKVLKTAISAGVITPGGVTEWTNYERVQRGLSPLIFNTTLAKAANAKIDDMLAGQYFEHDSPTGVGVDDLARNAGYAYIVVGENLAMGNFKDDQVLVQAWMESPGHRANIMNARYQEIGVAAKCGMFEGREVWLAVQEFGKPLSSCPEIDPMLKGLIEMNKIRTESLETSLQALRAELEAMEPKWGDAYNQKADEYNSLVGPYNELIKATRNLVDRYNAQVKAFNACATGI